MFLFLDAQLTGTSWQGRIWREIVRDDGKVPTGLVAQAKSFWERNLVRPGHVTEKVLKQRSGCESGHVLCERERVTDPSEAGGCSALLWVLVLESGNLCPISETPVTFQVPHYEICPRPLIQLIDKTPRGVLF